MWALCVCVGARGCCVSLHVGCNDNTHHRDVCSFCCCFFFVFFLGGDCVIEMKAGYLSLYACLLWQPMPKIGEGVEREWGVT